MMHGIPQVDGTHHRFRVRWHSRSSVSDCEPVPQTDRWHTGYTHQVQYTTDPGSWTPTGRWYDRSYAAYRYIILAPLILHVMSCTSDLHIISAVRIAHGPGIQGRMAPGQGTDAHGPGIQCPMVGIPWTDPDTITHDPPPNTPKNELF